MATASVVFNQRIDNYAVVQLLENLDIGVGQSFTLSGLGNDLNGTYTVYGLPQYLFIGVDSEGNLLFNSNDPQPNQVLFYDAGTDFERVAAVPPGTLTFTQTCTWITYQNIQDWLGFATVSAADQAFLTQCAAAANAFAFRRRKESGYFDSLSIVPSGDVLLGTIQLGGAYYRQRGSIDTFASFDGMATAPPVGLSGIIKQLLGIDRPQVA